MQLVLAEIGAADIPQLLVFNKLDAMAPEARPARLQDMYELDGRQVPRIFVSARQGEGISDLREQLAGMVMDASPSGMTPGQAPELPTPLG